MANARKLPSKATPTSDRRLLYVEGTADSTHLYLDNIPFYFDSTLLYLDNKLLYVDRILSYFNRLKPPFGDEGPQLSAALHLADSDEPSRLPLRS